MVPINKDSVEYKAYQWGNGVEPQLIPSFVSLISLRKMFDKYKHQYSLNCLEGDLIYTGYALETIDSKIHGFLNDNENKKIWTERQKFCLTLKAEIEAYLKVLLERAMKQQDIFKICDVASVLIKHHIEENKALEALNVALKLAANGSSVFALEKVGETYYQLKHVVNTLGGEGHNIFTTVFKKYKEQKSVYNLISLARVWFPYNQPAAKQVLKAAYKIAENSGKNEDRLAVSKAYTDLKLTDVYEELREKEKKN